jgi:hypothetical protein
LWRAGDCKFKNRVNGAQLKLAATNSKAACRVRHDMGVVR